jgi:hypothetical protein
MEVSLVYMGIIGRFLVRIFLMQSGHTCKSTSAVGSPGEMSGEHKHYMLGQTRNDIYTTNFCITRSKAGKSFPFFPYWQMETILLD